MFVLSCDIQIGVLGGSGSYRLSQVNEVTINKSWKRLGATASIKLPSLRKQLTKKSIEETLQEKFKVGDAVKISLAYDNVEKGKNLEFQGFIKSIKPNIPFEIECVDASYFLENINFDDKEFSSPITLEEVIEEIVKKVSVKYKVKLKVDGKLPKLSFENFCYNHETGLELLTFFRDNFGFYAYFDGDTLYVGREIEKSANQERTVIYNLDRNIISTDLTKRDNADKKFGIQASIVNQDYTKTDTIFVGDKDGPIEYKVFEAITIEKTELEKSLNEILNKEKYSGFDGTITSFLLPFAQPGMVADIKDPKIKEREGKFLIDEVEVSFGITGARRTLKIGRKIN